MLEYAWNEQNKLKDLKIGRAPKGNGTFSKIPFFMGELVVLGSLDVHLRRRFQHEQKVEIRSVVFSHQMGPSNKFYLATENPPICRGVWGLLECFLDLFFGLKIRPLTKVWKLKLPRWDDWNEAVVLVAR